MSDQQNSYLAWGAGIAAGIVGLATLGYMLGPVAKTEKPQPKVGSGPGASPPGASGSLSQEDLIRLLIQQQQQATQQPQRQQTPKPGGGNVSEEDIIRLLQAQAQAQAQQQALQGGSQPQRQGQPQRSSTALGSSTKALSSPPLTTSGTIPQAATEIATPQDRFREYLMTYREALSNKEFDEAEAILEEIARDFGRVSENWLVSTYECMRFYYSLQEWERCFNLAKKVLTHILPQPVGLATVERLIHVVFHLQKSANKIDKPLEGLEEGKQLLERIGELIDATADNPKDNETAVDYYVECASLLVLQKLRQFALWTELHVQDKVAPLQPFLLDRIIEAQAGSLHQEGKTAEAISRIRSFYNLIKDAEDQRKSNIVSWCLGRMAKFHFYLDQYQESLDLLLELDEYHRKHDSKIPLQELGDILSVYLELNDLENAAAIVERIKEREEGAIYTRSRLLITTDAVMTDRMYKLNVKVCRSPPARKEGDADDDESKYVRKLENFFLEVIYEAPSSLAVSEPLVTEQPVDHYDIDLQSPSFATSPKQAWYLIKMNVYKDGSKEELLGRHYQMLYKH